MLERWTGLLTEYIHESAEQMTREPEGILAHRYTVPSSPDSPYYSKALWDWDSWTISIALGQVELDTDRAGRFGDYELGSILNFLDHTDEDGVMPIQLSPAGSLLHGDPGRAGGFSQNMHKPVLAQQAALLSRRRGDVEWLRPHMPVVDRFAQRYVDSHLHAETGLAYWQTDFAVGVDNDPSVYYRPDRSTAAIYLNSLLYREFLALGYLWEQLGDLVAANTWRGRSQDLADALNRHAWDERDGTFYSVDLALRDIDPEDWLHKGAPRRWSSMIMRIDNWSSFLPLWAGFASAEQAARMVERYRDERTFHSAYGIRTLSRLEKMYDLRASNNPSNWLGPIWGISNYLMFRGLLKYGYVDDARDLAEKTVRLFGADLEANGSLHEYYHPDSGEPIITHGFQNWNFLVLNMIAYLEGRPVSWEF
ncbi:MGH1-like glycoside hydrolase domain-containing protein [Microbacterium sp. SSM24]|uniref:MGH1-like glycoside hydrolase domain-containing protein n=1 Tax=Microbacterium sp. SSM24 TaxID=2991714 RepID=UPI00222713CA|nr:trehalase family glycosidase [Microbacterium sp. SSM24]MCW3493269.1 trehalase family glycosidase [Microbacterium sp. SSM24]